VRNYVAKIFDPMFTGDCLSDLPFNPRWIEPGTLAERRKRIFVKKPPCFRIRSVRAWILLHISMDLPELVKCASVGAL
jgi:hypothetical protein